MTELNQKPCPEPGRRISLSRAATYQIKVQGHLDEYWSEWFDDLTITYDEQDDTILTGPVADQAALHGLLKKVRDLSLPLISVNLVESVAHTTQKEEERRKRITYFIKKRRNEMTTEQMNDMTTEQEGKEAGRHLEAIYWGGLIIWAGLVFGADSLGYLPEIGGASAWSWVFLGAGLYALLLALFRVTSPDYSNPTTSDYVWAGILMILGLGGFFSFNIAWPLILVLVGIAILGKTVLRLR